MIEKLLRMYETTEDDSVAWLLFNELDKINLWDDQMDYMFDDEEIQLWDV